MRALFLSSDGSISDIASATRRRMNGYADEIGELHVLMRSVRNKTTADGSITIHEVQVNKWLAPFLLPKHARSLVRAQGIEVISAQDPFEHGLIGYLATRGTSARLHVQIHTDFLTPWFVHGYTRQTLLNRMRVLVADFVLPKADGIRAVAPRVKRSLLARYGTRIKEPVVIPVLVTDEEEASEALAAPFPFTLLAVGRLEPEKRFGDALKVLAEVRKCVPEAGLVIAGEGSEGDRLRREVEVLGLEGSVRFLGMRSDVSQLYRASQVFLQTSAYEGYSRTLIEAARAGLPIVTTDVGIVGDVLMHDRHALVSHVGDIVSLALQVRALEEDAALRAQLSTQAKEAVAAHLKEFDNHAALIARNLGSVL